MAFVHVVKNVFLDDLENSKNVGQSTKLYLFLGTSIKTYKHYMQQMSGKFSKFDYGSRMNFELYGSVEPPMYNLKNIKVPTKLYVAEADEFSSVSKNSDLISDLPNSLGVHVVDQKDWNHMDFAFSSELREKVFNHILLDLYQYEQEFDTSKNKLKVGS